MCIRYMDYTSNVLLEVVFVNSVCHTLITHTPPQLLNRPHYVTKTRSVNLFIFGLARGVVRVTLRKGHSIKNCFKNMNALIKNKAMLM